MTIPSKEELQQLLAASVGGEVTLTPRQRGAMPDPKPGSPADIAAMQLLALGAPLAKEVLRLQEEYKRGQESRDAEVTSLREQRDALVASNRREKQLRKEDKDFWEKKFANLKAYLPVLSRK